MRSALAVVILALVASGCFGPAADEPGPDAGGEPTAQQHAWTGCLQMHQHYDGRAEDFQSQVPDGFTVAGDEAGLTKLLIHITDCGDGLEAFLGVRVDAPEELEDPDRDDVALLQVFASGRFLEVYPDGEQVIAADIRITESPTGFDVTVAGGEETWTTRAVLTPSSADFESEHWARWYETQDGLVKVAADGSPSQTVGFGPVQYEHTGPGGAPPATGGNVHVVEGLDWNVTVQHVG